MGLRAEPLGEPPVTTGDLAHGHLRRLPPASVRDAVRSAARVGALAGVATQLLSIAATLALARLLTPSDFGSIAAAQTVFGFALAFTEFGIRPTLVRRPVLDQEAASTFFWFSVGIGVVLAALMAAAARPFADLIGTPEAAPLAAVLAIGLIPVMAGCVPGGLLQRNFQTRRVYAVDLSTAVVYVVLEIALVLAGFGAMGVIVGQVIAWFWGFAWLSARSGWRPSARFRPSVLRADIGYSVGVLGTMSVSYLGKNVDYWFLGRAAGPATLGVYYVAFVLPNILRQRITTVAAAVLLPVFARDRNDPERLRRSYLESLGLHLVLGVPAMCGLALTADQVVTLFFGSQWDGATDALPLLCLAAGAEFATSAANTVLLATGRAGRAMLLQSVRLVLLVGGLIIARCTTGVGLVSTALVVLIATVGAAAFAQAMVCRQLALTPRQLGRTAATVLVPCAAMSAVLRPLAVHAADAPAALTLTWLAATGAALFLVVGTVVFRAAFRELLAESARIVLPARLARPLRSRRT